MKVYGKRPARLNNVINSMNTTHINRKCVIDTKHGDTHIVPIKLEVNKPLYIKNIGLYKFEYNNKNYVIHIPYNNDNQYIIMNNIYNLSLYIDGIYKYRISPYEVIENDKNEKYVNSYFDLLYICANTIYIGDTISINAPATINRCNYINFMSFDNNNNDNELSINLPYSIGKLNNGVYDKLILDSENMICNIILNTNYEMLTGAFIYKYIEELSSTDTLVFFIKNENIKSNAGYDSIFCTHFLNLEDKVFYDKDNNTNGIVIPNNDDNGFLLKISKTYLDINNSTYESAIKKFVMDKAISNNPIYIEYELSKPKYITILLDEYHLKTYYPNTLFFYNANTNVPIFVSKFFKTL